jgi:hypothetical protein
MVAMVVFLFSDRVAPIATSMVVVRPGTIGTAPEGLERQWKTAGGGFFASRCKADRRRKKAGDGCCGKTIEVKPVFGQTQFIRGRRGRSLQKASGT